MWKGSCWGFISNKEAQKAPSVMKGTHACPSKDKQILLVHFCSIGLLKTIKRSNTSHTLTALTFSVKSCLGVRYLKRALNHCSTVSVFIEQMIKFCIEDQIWNLLFSHEPSSHIQTQLFSFPQSFWIIFALILIPANFIS